MRKSKDVTITAAGRDTGKVFRITEMSASQAEKWAWRAFSAMARAGVDIPPGIAEMGMPGLIMLGFNKIFGADPKDAEPLLDEMFGCIQSVQPAMTRALIEDDIEEVATRLFLRSEVFEIHTNFSVAAFLSKTWEAAATKLAEPSPSIQTSPDGSEPLSQPA